jgi:hypothetical protein
MSALFRGDGVMSEMMELAEIIKEFFPDVIAVYCLDSQNNQVNSQNNSLQAAVLLVSPADKEVVAQCVSRLEAQVKENGLADRIEFIDLRRATSLVAGQILSKGKRIFSCDNLYCDRFEIATLSQYIRFSDERAALADIA